MLYCGLSQRQKRDEQLRAQQVDEIFHAKVLQQWQQSDAGENDFKLTDIALSRTKIGTILADSGIVSSRRIVDFSNHQYEHLKQQLLELCRRADITRTHHLEFYSR